MTQYFSEMCSRILALKWYLSKQPDKNNPQQFSHESVEILIDCDNSVPCD